MRKYKQNSLGGGDFLGASKVVTYKGVQAQFPV